MAFQTVTLAVILCDHHQCTRHVDDLIPEEQTHDWPAQFDPTHHRHLEDAGWWITREHTLCPTHGKTRKAAARAEAERQALIEVTHEPLFDLPVAG